MTTDVLYEESGMEFNAKLRSRNLSLFKHQCENFDEALGFLQYLSIEVGRQIKIPSSLEWNEKRARKKELAMKKFHGRKTCSYKYFLWSFSRGRNCQPHRVFFYVRKTRLLIIITESEWKLVLIFMETSLPANKEITRWEIAIFDESQSSLVILE